MAPRGAHLCLFAACPDVVSVDKLSSPSSAPDGSLRCEFTPSQLPQECTSPQYKVDIINPDDPNGPIYATMVLDHTNTGLGKPS